MTTCGWRDGFLGDHTRPPGLRQGTTVCVHTSMDVEQQSDHKLMGAVWDGVIGLWEHRSHPSYHLGVVRRDVPMGVNLKQYSLVQDHLFVGTATTNPCSGHRISLQLIVSMSFGHSVVFQVRRVTGDVPSSITLDHGDLLVMDGPAQSEVCTSHGAWAAGSLVLTLLTAGLHITCCVLSTCRRSWLCSPIVCARFGRAKFLLVGRGGK